MIGAGVHSNQTWPWHAREYDVENSCAAGGLLGVGLRYEDWRDYQQLDQSRPGFHETLIRSRDGGRTWGDPTEVHAHVAETCYAVDPNNPKHVLAMTRKQRMLLRNEDAVSVARRAGVPPSTAWPWKGAILLESQDGGRKFREVPESYLGYYSHRGTMLWTKENVIVAPHTATGPRDYRLVASISLDGGKTWVDGTQHGASAMSKARSFELVSTPPGFSFTTPTVQVSRNRFLTVYCSGTPMAVQGVFWHLRRLAPCLLSSDAFGTSDRSGLRIPGGRGCARSGRHRSSSHHGIR